MHPPLNTFMVFDTNAVRELGRMEDADWTWFDRAWRERGYQTAWIPHVACEIVASNVARSSDLTKDDLHEVQRAARRFNELACGAVLHDVDEVVYRSIYTLAKMDAPPSTFDDRRADWRNKRVFWRT